MFHTRWLEPSTVGCWSITHLTRRDFWTWETVPTKCWVNRILQHELGNQPRQQDINQSSYKLFLCLFSWCSCFFFQNAGLFSCFLSRPQPEHALCASTEARAIPNLPPAGDTAAGRNDSKAAIIMGICGGPHLHHLRLLRDHSFVTNPLTRSYFLGGWHWGGYKNQRLFNQEMIFFGKVIL